MLSDGEEDDLIQKIRKQKRYRNLPVVLMSGIIFNVDSRAKAVGADDYLKNPFSPFDLKEIINRYLATDEALPN